MVTNGNSLEEGGKYYKYMWIVLAIVLVLYFVACIIAGFLVYKKCEFIDTMYV